VPAALCSASASNLLGVFLTPLIAGFLLAGHGVVVSARSVFAIAVQLLLPFVAGQLLPPWIGAFVVRNARAMKSVDYGSILLIVYSAFSQGVVNGIWHQIDATQLFQLLLVDASLLVAAITILTFASRQLGFSRADEITIGFCGSKKSLASGLHCSQGTLASLLYPYVDLGVGAFLENKDLLSRPSVPDANWVKHAGTNNGRVQVPTLRNVDKRPNPEFVKAYGHNGYFKSLKEIVHFYNTRDLLPQCQPGDPGEKTGCWPPPETTANMNTKTVGHLGLAETEENALVAFMRTLTDCYQSGK